MSPRPFEWRDLPALHRYRNHCVFLHNALLLTRGPLMIPGALLSSITPVTGLFTSVNHESADTGPLIGQMVHTTGAAYGHLTFLAPNPLLDSPALLPLIEHLGVQVGERGALRLLAEVEETSPVFTILRQSSFAIYARQRIWQLADAVDNRPSTPDWQPAGESDTLAVRLLYNSLVPGLVQQVEPQPVEPLRGLVHRRGGDLLAYVELAYGPRGIWAQPFIHPDAENVAARLVDLLRSLPNRRSRPVYVCIRSYQSWLELPMEASQARPGPRQAVMVRHLAVHQKAARAFSLPALEGGQAEISAPVARIETK